MRRIIVVVTALVLGLTFTWMLTAQAQSAEQVLLVALQEKNASGQTGWATLTARGDQTEVVLSLTSGNVESELVHIHSGSCNSPFSRDSLGGVVHGLTDIVDGRSVTTVDATLMSLRGGGFAINSHKKSEPSVYTTCGNVPVEADAVTIALDEQNSSGQTGWATLTARGNKTEVVLAVSEGTLESELVHIHSGSCGNDTLGGVVHGLTSIAGGASVTTVDVTLSSLRVGDLAINSHQKGEPAVYTTCGSIPPGQPDVLLVALGEQNGSGQTGWARLTSRGDQTVVVVNVLPGALESELVHIHSGSCGADTLGGVVHGLTNIAEGVSVTAVDATLTSLRSGDFAVNSHKTGEPAVYTACGNIPTEADALTVQLAEGNGSGQQGWATLTARGGQTEVVLGLSPGLLESGLAQVRSGVCAGLSNSVIHPLNDVSGGASSTTLDVPLVSLRGGGLAIVTLWNRYPVVRTTCGDVPAGDQEVLLVALGEQNDSGQTGWASLTANGDKTEVVVSVSRGNVESELIHIHSGSCGGDTLGGVVHGLTRITGGVSVTTVDATLASLRTGDFAINSHKKGEPAVYTTCGNIPTEAEALTIRLDEQNDSGQGGWATLTARGSNTEVVVSVSPGRLSSELIHIHSGSCGNDTLGGVVHGLTNIAGGASVTSVGATLASLRTGGFAINSHKKGEPAVYTTCGNVPAGQPDVLLVALGEQNDSGQVGTATLTAKGSQTVVVVNVGAGNVESELIHIHSGSCGGDTLGGVVHGLTSIAGGGSVTTVDATLASLRTGDFAINSHKKGEPAVYTTCGNIPTAADGLTVALDEQNASGQAGYATLTVRGAQTEVVLSVAPGALVSELVHIHSGSCGNDTLGGVVHALTNIAGGASATTVDATLADLRTGDFAINSHKLGEPAVYTTCGNIPV